MAARTWLGAIAALVLASGCEEAPPPRTATRVAPKAAAAPAAAVAPARVPVTLLELETPWQSATPEAAGLSRPALEVLVRQSEESGSDALLVLAGDRVVVARNFGHAPEALDTKSVTKGFVGVAIGFLIAEGKLTLDQPLSTWFKEWKDGPKSKVLLRHVVTHMSGLSHEPMAYQLESHDDRLAYVRGLPLVSEPGATFSYNNEACMLLSGVVAAAAGEPIDTYLRPRLFAPLGITDAKWSRDPAGNVTTNGGLMMSAISLAKVGLALRDRRVVPSAWLTAMQEPTPKASWMGLLTFLSYDGWNVSNGKLRARLGRNGFDAASKLAPLDGKHFATGTAYWLAAAPLLTPEEREQLGAIVRNDLVPFAWEGGPQVGFNWPGWLGQWLVVFPKAGVVAVRQRRQPAKVDDTIVAEIGMDGFVGLARAALPQ